MSILLGGSEVSGMYLGSKEISEMYLGGNLFYSSGWPYETFRVSKDGGATWEDYGRPVKVETWMFERSGVTHVELPDSIISIEAAAFWGNNIETLYIPESVKTIDDNAFRNNKLTYIEFPETLESIGVRAFRDNYNLAEVRISSRTAYATGSGSTFPISTNIITY